MPTVPLKHRLRLRLFILIALAIVPIAAFAVVSAIRRYQNDLAQAQLQTRLLARDLASQQDQLVPRVSALLLTLVQVDSVRQLDIDACNQLFTQLTDNHADLANLGLVGLDGRARASAIDLEQSVDLGDRPWFTRALASSSVVSGPFQVGRITDKPTINFALRVPDAQGQPAAVLYAAINLAWIHDRISAQAERVSSRVLMVDPDGVVLSVFPASPNLPVGAPADPNLIRDIQNGATTLRMTDQHGTRSIVAAEPISSLADQPVGYLIVATDESVAFASTRRWLSWQLAYLALICCSFFILAWAYSDRIIHQPIVALRSAATRLGRGDLSARTGIAADQGELGLLATAFDQAAEQLQASFSRTVAAEKHASHLAEHLAVQLERTSALRRIDLAITSSLDLRLTLNVVLDEVTTQLKVSAACILLLENNSQTLTFSAGRGLRNPQIRRERIRMGDGPVGVAALEQQLLAIVPLDADFQRAPLATLEGGSEPASYIGVPLISKSKLVGFLEIYDQQQLDPEEHWLEFLEALAGQAAIAIENSQLFDHLQQSHVQLQLAYESTLEGWSRALELRDNETQGHSQRVTAMSVELARALELPESDIIHIRRGALLHDIGKMGVPDEILLKPGRLTAEEWIEIRKHPMHAHRLLAPIAFLAPALDIPYAHHERWDGTGYPRGLKGAEIPLAARLFAIVDVWDALSSDRPYRQALPLDEVIEYLQQNAGAHFDPAIVPVFVQMLRANAAATANAALARP